MPRQRIERSMHAGVKNLSATRAFSSPLIALRKIPHPIWLANMAAMSAMIGKLEVRQGPVLFMELPLFVENASVGARQSGLHAKRDR